jgi:xylulose-5-phosphate/fructose-6-phosphate phosphoketolase
LQFVAEGIECFLKSKRPLTLGQAFGLEPRRGNQSRSIRGPGKNFELAKKALPLRAGGWAWPKILDHLELYDLSAEELRKIDAYWRASNYLSVGQIYLLDNPLLREPLKREHIKPRLLGHWGTSPGLNMLYVHLNRVIKSDDLNMIYVIGPGHGGPSLVAHAYLEGTYSEVYPNIGQDAEGMRKLFKQFSFPGGIPSHVAPETPGSIHEGGELGYALSHAYGAAFDNPDLIVACVVGDGEAETGPLATAWHSNKFLNPATDGAVLPILHLNGYKTASPTLLARITRCDEAK